ncbi:DUF1775 domain-containing protein [Yinghuangia seranimata]|uniref:DUF1775 domain-containing protein n=1 Tax=Yinghuangia seranimata TaxID=408067 RepID=UPI00248B7BC9|nr:DUF1775 domain-containing protein [Yinghuangia seranimata]MDI2128415.1 DUF1775 domain-containing protein [Yinghuangia seranimata]
MLRSFRMPAARRVVVAGIAAGAFALAAATPAFAHNEVSASDTHALATDVTLTFGAEAESKTAGITQLQVVLPQGITPSDVTFVEGPDGWKFTPGADGYTLAGPALATGADAEYKVKVRQLPDTTTLVFKTLQTYSDGRIDRWIDPPATGDDHSDSAGKPAPALKLQKAAPGAVPIPPSPAAAPSSAAPAASAPATSAAPSAPVAAATPAATPSAAAAPTASDKKDDDSSALPIVLGVIGGVVVLGGAGAWWWRRRGATPQG